MHLVKINRNGQVSIPAKIRRKFHLGEGRFLRVEETQDGKMTLTPVTIEDFISKTPDYLKKYEEAGIDIGLLRSSLEKTPTERAETNRALLKFTEEARRAREKKSHADS